MLLMGLTPVRPAFLAICVVTPFTEMVDMLAVLLFAMLAGQFDAAAVMLMLAPGFPAVVASGVNASAGIGNRMLLVRLAIWYIAMIAQNIIASGTFVLDMLTIFFRAVIARGIFTSAVCRDIMGYMLAIFGLTMRADYNLAKALMLYVLTE